mgnify:CR=1 FL=1
MGLVEAQIVKPKRSKWIYEGVDTRNRLIGWNGSNCTKTVEAKRERLRYSLN